MTLTEEQIDKLLSRGWFLYTYPGDDVQMLSAPKYSRMRSWGGKCSEVQYKGKKIVCPHSAEVWLENNN